MPTSGSPVSGTSVRWPWLLLGVGGLLVSIALLIVSLPQARPKRSAAPASMSKSRAPGRVVSEEQAAPMAVAPGPPGPPPMAQPPPPPPPVAAPEAKEPAKADGATPNTGRISPPRPAKKKMAKLPMSREAPAPRSVKLDSDDGPSVEDRPAPPAAKAERPAKTVRMIGGKGSRRPSGRGAMERRDDGDRDDTVAEGAMNRGAAHGADSAEAEGAALAKLLPGRFHAKVPKEMRLNVGARVKVVVSDEKADNEAKATLEAATVSSAGGPAQVVNADVLIGKLLRVELRALSSEFEIMAITPPEQRVVAGRVSTWEWAVVPHAEGEHQLSAIVTNLTDWNGKPLDLTVQEITVNVEVSTMDKLRAAAGLVSSGISGLAGLLGAWMGVLRPLLKRREEDRDSRDKKPAAAAAGPDPAGGKPAPVPAPADASASNQATAPAPAPPNQPQA